MLNQIIQDNLATILIAMTVLLVLLIILSIIMLVKLSHAKKRYKMLLNGATGEDLELAFHRSFLAFPLAIILRLNIYFIHKTR